MAYLSQKTLYLSQKIDLKKLIAIFVHCCATLLFNRFKFNLKTIRKIMLSWTTMQDPVY